MDHQLVLSNLKFVGRKLSYDLEGFPGMNPGQKMFVSLSMFDIQRKNRGYSICQIVQNNGLLTRLGTLKERM